MHIDIFISTCIYTIPDNLCSLGLHLGPCYNKFTGMHDFLRVSQMCLCYSTVDTGVHCPLLKGRARGCSCSPHSASLSLTLMPKHFCDIEYVDSHQESHICLRSPSFVSFSKGGNWSQVKSSISQQTD